VARRIVMEEFHLTVYAPRGLPAPAYDALRQALDDPPVHAARRRAVRRHPAPSQAEGRRMR
jgi:hypothetical protein